MTPVIVTALEKAPLRGAFLLCLFFITLLSFPAGADDCKPCLGVLHEVSRVIDGDTLALKSGATVRLIGINTPELGRQGEEDQPGAGAARDYLQGLVERSSRLIHVCPGAERQDRYGRRLAHVSDREGRSMVRQLLRQGMGHVIAVPPNLGNSACYQDAESLARKAGLGVWREPLRNAASLRGDETGFHHLEGRIVRVGESRSAVWLNLEGGLALRITWKEWAAFQIEDPEQLVGEHLEARGWIYRRKGAQRLRIRHPSALRWLE